MTSDVLNKHWPQLRGSLIWLWGASVFRSRGHLQLTEDRGAGLGQEGENWGRP